MTLDEVISELESDFVTWGTKLGMAKLVSLAPSFFASAIGAAIGQWFAGIIVEEIAKYLDYASYYTYKTISNNLAASNYEDAIRASNAAAESGDANAIQKAKDAQISAFANVWSLT